MKNESLGSSANNTDLNSLLDFTRNPMFSNTMSSSYDEQRKERLMESIDEYLMDCELPPEKFYEELKEGVQEIIDYHKKNMNKALTFMNMMQGHRDVNLDDPELAAKWQYDKIPGRY